MECTNPNGTGIMGENRNYIVTPNEWDEVESLGKTIHFETDGIYYEEIRAKSPGEAKARYLYYEPSYKYIDLRCRLRKNVRL